MQSIRSKQTGRGRAPVRSLLLSLAVVLLPAMLSGCAGVDAQVPDGVVNIDIVYATDREISGDQAPEDYFSNRRGTLSFGSARIAVPQHPEADATYWQPETGKIKKPRLAAVAPVEGLTPVEFLNAAARDRSDRSALVYIHGYKKNFERATRNLADIVYGADYRGLPVLFSWPSNDSTMGYAADTNTLRWSTRNFVETLNHLADVNDLDTIHLVAHSMGSQAVLHALENSRPPSEQQPWLVGEVVLYAPDVDRDRFMRDAMPALHEAGIRTTLYVSDLDVPLWSSRVVNSYPRLGDAAAGIVVAPGLETVDTSEVSGLFNTHIYHLGLPTQRDLGLLLNDRLGAAQRDTLTEVEGAQGLYWILKPPEKTSK